MILVNLRIRFVWPLKKTGTSQDVVDVSELELLHIVGRNDFSQLVKDGRA